MSDSIRIDRYANRQDWLDARQETIGASESAVLFGIGYKGATPLSLYTDKVFGKEERGSDPMFLKIGTLIEPVILQLVREWVRENQSTGEIPYKFDEFITDSNDYDVWVRDDYLSATPDGVIYLLDSKREIVASGVLEFKNVGIWAAAEWKDGMPLKHQAQVQHQLMCTGYDFGILAGLIGGNSFEVRIVKRNETFIKELKKVCAAFWKCVQEDIEPQAVDLKVDKRVLEQLHPDDNGETIELDDEATALVADSINRKQLIKENQKKVDANEAKLRQIIGDNTFAKAGANIVSLKTQTRKERVQKVAASKFRVLRIKESKE